MDDLAWLALFAQWFGPPARASSRCTRPPTNTRRLEGQREYPPVDSGLPAIPVAEVIAPQVEWMKRLRYAYGADQATFDRDIGAVVERYAQYVHLLPATPEAYFRGAGGLFRMGLETGFVALQATDGAIFSGRQTITQRSTLEPRWRYATFIAGLLSELHRALSHFIVTDAQGRRVASVFATARALAAGEEVEPLSRALAAQAAGSTRARCGGDVLTS